MIDHSADHGLLSGNFGKEISPFARVCVCTLISGVHSMPCKLHSARRGNGDANAAQAKQMCHELCGQRKKWKGLVDGSEKFVYNLDHDVSTNSKNNAQYEQQLEISIRLVFLRVERVSSLSVSSCVCVCVVLAKGLCRLWKIPFSTDQSPAKVSHICIIRAHFAYSLSR